MTHGQTQVDALAKRIETLRDAYYNGTPLVGDYAYDLLEDELRLLAPNHPILAKVGAPVPSGPLVGGGWPKVTHTIPMTSLNKAQTLGEMQAWIGAAPAPHYMITDKLDGLSVSLRYENRRLVQALTRGDGLVGEDITRNVLLMKGAVTYLPAKLPDGRPTPTNVWVRGEMIVTRSDFAAHFHGESNPRNTASGTAKRQSDPSKCAYVTVMAYQFLPNGVPLDCKKFELEDLATLGFLVPNWQIVNTLKEAEVYYATYVATTRKSLDYEIDGLVIDVDDSETRETLGDLNGRPKGAIAWKFPHEEKPTTLRAIRWQVGNSGRITPVAEFDAVTLVGASIKQASLHNVSNITTIVEELRKGETLLCEGDQILVSRRNDVIPFVENLFSSGDLSKPFLVPTACPCCQAGLVRDGEYLLCKNLDCEAQASGAIKRWISKIGVLNFGETLIDTLVECGMVNDIADLYALDPVVVASLDMNGRRVGATADKAITNLNAKKALPLHVLVGSIGISPLIGRSMCQTIENAGYDTLSKMLKARVGELAAVPGVGGTKAQAFVEGFQAKVGLIAKLIGEAGITIATVSGPLLGQSFCFTGFRDANLEGALVGAGATIKSSAGKGLTYLVALDPNSGSGKLQAAMKNGTKVISVPDAKAMVGL